MSEAKQGSIGPWGWAADAPKDGRDIVCVSEVAGPYVVFWAEFEESQPAHEPQAAWFSARDEGLFAYELEPEALWADLPAGVDPDSPDQIAAFVLAVDLIGDFYVDYARQAFRLNP